MIAKRYQSGRFGAGSVQETAAGACRVRGASDKQRIMLLGFSCAHAGIVTQMFFAGGLPDALRTGTTLKQDLGRGRSYFEGAGSTHFGGSPAPRAAVERRGRSERRADWRITHRPAASSARRIAAFANRARWA